MEYVFFNDSTLLVREADDDNALDVLYQHILQDCVNKNDDGIDSLDTEECSYPFTYVESPEQAIPNNSQICTFKYGNANCKYRFSYR